MSSTSPTRPPRTPRAADLADPATQIVSNRADYLGEGQRDIGHRVTDDKLELFVTTDPAQALLQEFARQAPDYIALHDVGGSASLRLLAAVAETLNTKPQQLDIRRQGHGVALATLRFIELPGQGEQKLRVYSTDADADSGARRQIANVLLGHSRLAVLLVGELPAHALAAALKPVQDGLRKGPWPNRHLLMVPRGAASAVAAHAADFGAGSDVQVHATARVEQLNDTWTFITGAWNRVRQGGAIRSPSAASPVSAPVRRSSADLTPLAEDASTEPMPLVAASSAAPSSDSPHPRWEAYVQACSAIKGLVSACVFDARTMKLLAHNGGRPDGPRLMTQGMALFHAMANCGRNLGLGPSQPDGSITLTAHHLLLHPLPGHPGVLLHAVLDGSVANLTLARMQLQRVDTTVLAPPDAH